MFVEICLLIQNLKKSCRSVILWRSYRHFSLSKIPRFSIITPVKKGAREMILTLWTSFVKGYQPTKISFLGGPAHFVTYGDDSDGLVDNNNALTMLWRAR
jgi:hypothetical protein